MLNERAVEGPNAGELLDFRIKGFQSRGQRICGRRDEITVSCLVQDPENPFLFLVELVEAQLIPHPKSYQDEAGHPDGQAHDFDERVSFLACELAESYFYMAYDHCQPPCHYCENE